MSAVLLNGTLFKIMDKKIVAKKYLIIVLSMLAGFGLLSLAIVFSLCKTGNSSLDLSNAQMFLLSLACAYVPCASFTGFCVAFINASELSRLAKILIVCLYPLVLLGVTLIGIIMVIPSIIRATIVLVK